MKEGIHIGTSGWSYAHWKGLFYPKGCPSSDWLDFYARQFDTTEINGSFYRLPSRETVIGWTKSVPPGFLFCPKMNRFLTHMKKLSSPEEPLERFFGVFSAMKNRMGPVLLQLPRMLKFHPEKAAHLYRLLNKTYRSYTFVLEVRHASWLEEDSLRLMREYAIGLVISHSGDHFPYSEIITARTVYLRLHGPQELYASSYPEETLRELAKKFRKWVRDGHEVWAFFNNDIHGHAITDAKRLARRLQK